LYSAKGLEAEYVFIMWLNDKFFPAPHKDIREELRVFYVGMTRAKENVIFTFHETFNNRTKRREAPISPFLQKISNHINIIRLTKPDLARILSGL